MTFLFYLLFSFVLELYYYYVYVVRMYFESPRHRLSTEGKY